MRFLKFVFLGILAVFFIACSKDELPLNGSIIDKKYEVIKLVYKNQEYLANDSAYIEFNNEDVNGSSGCNSFFGGVNYYGNQIIFGNIGATRRMCHDYAFEGKFFQALTKLNISNTPENDNLILSNEDFTIFIKPAN